MRNTKLTNGVEPICKNGWAVYGECKEVWHYGKLLAYKDTKNKEVVICGRDVAFSTTDLKCIRWLVPFIKGKGTCVDVMAENLKGLYETEIIKDSNGLKTLIIKNVIC